MFIPNILHICLSCLTTWMHTAAIWCYLNYIIFLQHCLIVQLVYIDSEPLTILSLPATFLSIQHWALSPSSELLTSFLFFFFPPELNPHCHILKALPRSMLLCHEKLRHGLSFLASRRIIFVYSLALFPTQHIHLHICCSEYQNIIIVLYKIIHINSLHNIYFIKPIICHYSQIFHTSNTDTYLC